MTTLAEPDLSAILDAMEFIAPPEGWTAANEASELAERYYVANRAALVASQPDVAKLLPESLPPYRWLFARDGSLTARVADGTWFSGCSLPQRTAESLLRRLDVKGRVACFLAPAHPSQMQVALQRMASSQAMIAILPDEATLPLHLACCDLSQAIADHRLFIAAGAEWGEGLGNLHARWEGLPVPIQFIRTATTDESISDALIPLAEKIFAQVSAHQQSQAAAIKKSFQRPADIQNLLILAPTHYRLWNLAPLALLQAARQAPMNVQHLNLDDPASASIVTLARMAAKADALFAADMGRADLPAVLPEGQALVSWITTPRLPNADPAHPHDRLLLADELWLATARAAGWPADRLAVAAWPPIALSAASAQSPHIALIAATRSLETPVEKLEHSSHHILWNVIRKELTADPFAVGDDALAYLRRHLRKAGIAEAAFDFVLFLEMIEAAYMQAVVDRLQAAEIPVRIYGPGWEAHRAYAGAAATMPQFLTAAGEATVLLHAWPLRHRHAIDALPRPVLRSGPKMLTEARRLLEKPNSVASQGKILTDYFTRP